MAAPSQQMTF